MESYRRYLAVVAASALMTIPSMAAGQPSGGPEGPRFEQRRGMRHRMHDGQRRGRGRDGARMMKALGLSEDQQKQMKALRSAQQKEQIRLKAEVKIAHLELRDLVQQANGPSGAVATKVAKVGELQSRLLKQRVDFQLKRKAVLTDEQRKKLEVLRSVPPARQDGRWRGRAESRGREK